MFGRIIIAVSPQYTYQKSSSWHRIVRIPLSERTHTDEWGCMLDRDKDANRNLLIKGLETVNWEELSQVQDSALAASPAFATVQRKLD